MKKMYWVIVIVLFSQACRSISSDRIKPDSPVSNEPYKAELMDAKEVDKKFAELAYLKQKMELEQEKAVKLLTKSREENVASLVVEQTKAKMLDSIVVEKERVLSEITGLLTRERSRSDELSSQINLLQNNKGANIFEMIDKTVNELPSGNYVFTAKNHMLVGETQVAKLALSVSEPLEKLRKELGQNKESGRIFLEGRIQVAPSMKVTMTLSSGLSMRTIQGDEEERLIPSEGIHEWSWELTAIRPGDQHITINVFVVLKLDGIEKKYLVETLERTITIRITPIGRLTAFLKSNWQWAWGAWIVPFFVLIRNHGKKRKKRK